MSQFPEFFSLITTLCHCLTSYSSQYVLSVVCLLEFSGDFGWVSRLVCLSHHSWWWVSFLCLLQCFLPSVVIFCSWVIPCFLAWLEILFLHFCILLTWRCLFFSFLLFLSFLEKLRHCHHIQSWGVLLSGTLRINFIDCNCWVSRLCLFQKINGANSMRTVWDEPEFICLIYTRATMNVDTCQKKQIVRRNESCMFKMGQKAALKL